MPSRPTSDALAELAERLNDTRSHLLKDVETLREMLAHDADQRLLEQRSGEPDMRVLDVERLVTLAKAAVDRAARICAGSIDRLDEEHYALVYVTRIAIDPDPERHSDAASYGLSAIRAVTDTTR